MLARRGPFASLAAVAGAAPAAKLPPPQAQPARCRRPLPLRRPPRPRPSPSRSLLCPRCLVLFLSPPHHPVSTVRAPLAPGFFATVSVVLVAVEVPAVLEGSGVGQGLWDLARGRSKPRPGPRRSQRVPRAGNLLRPPSSRCEVFVQYVTRKPFRKSAMVVVTWRG